MKVSIRSIVCGCLAVFVGLAAILGLTANFIKLGVAESGFDFFSFKSDVFRDWSEKEGNWSIEYRYAWFAYLVGAFSILQCVLGAAAIIFGGLSIGMLQCRKSATAFSIAACAATLVYMVFGFIGLAFCNEMELIGAKTTAFIPFIFTLICLIGYLICLHLVPEKYLGNNAARAGAVPYPAAPSMQPPRAASSMQPVKDPAVFMRPPQSSRQNPAFVNHAPVPPVPPAYSAGPSPVYPGTPVPPPVQRSAYAAQKPAEKMSEERRLDLIERYAQLLKDGVITQEDFDAKKKQLLGL
ncbi:MAG TPA: SHOCT domain-containing protein [Candidatus Borkfalkia excrementavium]|uniref:SHOCT domain-containing protein n=1 Tax=Candidatus Borkfalkia excrementavium TaxID=2838505 RepID=A0A9D1Z7W2_9FIRM|nr:SHOCT domain-containing protein [Candidatus Borkfalkia excrementavium]